MNITSEGQLKNLLKISDWNHMSGNSILQYIKLLPNLQKQLHFKVLDQVPQMADKIGSAMDLIKNTISESEKLSTETKETYSEIVKALDDMLKKDNLSSEEHDRIYQELVKIASFINTASQRDEEFLNKVITDIFKTAVATILVIGIFFGAKSIFTSLI